MSVRHAEFECFHHSAAYILFYFGAFINLGYNIGIHPYIKYLSITFITLGVRVRSYGQSITFVRTEKAVMYGHILKFPILLL